MQVMQTYFGAPSLDFAACNSARMVLFGVNSLLGTLENPVVLTIMPLVFAPFSSSCTGTARPRATAHSNSSRE